MSLVGWLIVLSLPVVAAVQLAAMVVLGRRLELDDDAPRPFAWGEAPTPEDDGHAPAGASDHGTCPLCGTRNDPGFTYCRGCVQRLRAAG